MSRDGCEGMFPAALRYIAYESSTHMNISKKPETQTPPDREPRLLYSRKQAAYQLSDSLRIIDYKLASGQLRYTRQGGRVKISHAELLRQAAIDDNTPVVPRCRRHHDDPTTGAKETK